VKRKEQDLGIKNRKDILFLLNRGNRWHCKYFSIVFFNNNSGKLKAAVIVSRRLGNAVIRNRTKRMFRDVISFVRKNGKKEILNNDILILPKTSNLPSRKDILENFNTWEKHLYQSE
jgi:ribonuclease P protein component